MNCVNAKTANAKQAFMTDNEIKYTAGQQIFLFNWGMEMATSKAE